jgi:hypothetical protein
VYERILYYKCIFCVGFPVCSRTRPACVSICISMSGTPGGIVVVGTSNMPRSVRVELLNHLAVMVYLCTPTTVGPRDQIQRENVRYGVRKHIKCIRKYFKCHPEFVFARGGFLYVVRNILLPSGSILNAVRNLFSHAETFYTSPGIFFCRPEAF